MFDNWSSEAKYLNKPQEKEQGTASDLQSNHMKRKNIYSQAELTTLAHKYIREKKKQGRKHGVSFNSKSS